MLSFLYSFLKAMCLSTEHCSNIEHACEMCRGELYHVIATVCWDF